MSFSIYICKFFQTNRMWNYNHGSALRRVIDSRSHYFHRELKTEVEKWKSEMCSMSSEGERHTDTLVNGVEKLGRIPWDLQFKKTAFRNFGLSWEHIKKIWFPTDAGWELKSQGSRETFAWPEGSGRKSLLVFSAGTDSHYIITSIWVMLF